MTRDNQRRAERVIRVLYYSHLCGRSHLSRHVCQPRCGFCLSTSFSICIVRHSLLPHQINTPKFARNRQQLRTMLRLEGMRFQCNERFVRLIHFGNYFQHGDMTRISQKRRFRVDKPPAPACFLLSSYFHGTTHWRGKLNDD